MGEEMINLSPIPRSEERKIEREREKEKKEEEEKTLRIILPVLHRSIIYGPKLTQPSECKAESHHR